MAEQEEGWPLGLQPLNMRGGLVRNHNNFSGSISFNTLLSGTPTSSSSSDSSSDLDTESTGSFFRDRSITLGSLIGVPRVVEISRRSARGRRRRRTDHQNQTSALGDKKTYGKSKTWCFSLCPRDNTEVEIANNNTIPLGHFLAVERRAATEHRRISHSPLLYGPDELSMAQAYRETNSLFVNGQIAPPPPRPPPGSSTTSPYSSSENAEIRSDGSGNEYAAASPMLFPCICGHSS